MKRFFALSLLAGFINMASGQKSFSPLTAITKAYSDTTIFSYLNTLTDTATEDFELSRNVYSFKYFRSGFLLEFNFNFILCNVWLHDSGYAFKSYKGKLPYNLKWGMKPEIIQEKKYGFDPDSLNPYVYHRTFDKGVISAYFYGNKLKSLYIAARPDLIKTEDESMLSRWGFRLYPDGKKVDGDYIDGFGVMMWDEETRSYEGDWKWGMPHGKGRYTDPTGVIYEGNFKMGFAWGNAHVVYPDVAVYDGSLLFSRYNGFGKIVYKTGVLYEGDWLFDTMQGQGTYYLNSNYSYVGSFAKNQFNGKGKLITPDGYFDGSFKDGKPHGKGEQFANKTHAMLRGTWVNGSKEGSFFYHDPLTGSRWTVFKGDKEVIPGE